MLWMLRAGGQVLVCIHTQFACQSHLGRPGNLSLTTIHYLFLPFYHFFSSRGTPFSPFFFVFICVTEILSNQAPPKVQGIMCQAPLPGDGPLLRCPVFLGMVSHRNCKNEFCHQEIVTAKFYCLKTRCFISETICLCLTLKIF